jgi:hypothetical protein
VAVEATLRRTAVQLIVTSPRQAPVSTFGGVALPYSLQKFQAKKRSERRKHRVYTRHAEKEGRGAVAPTRQERHGAVSMKKRKALCHHEQTTALFLKFGLGYVFQYTLFVYKFSVLHFLSLTQHKRVCQN